MTLIVGLDLSLTAPGWFVHEPSGVTHHGTWNPGKLQGLVRMQWILSRVLGLVGVAPKEDGTLVVIEGFSFGSKGRSVYEIAGLGYIVRYALWRRGFQVVEVTPSQLKKFATGKGNAPKEIIIREVFKRWGIDAADNNAADAVVLGRIGMHIAQVDSSENLTAFQREVLKGIKV